MAVQISTGKDTQTGNDDYLDIQGENKIELANIYDSLQDRDDDVHRYDNVRSASDVTNTGANNENSKEHPNDAAHAGKTKINIELSCMAICLTLTGMLLFCTLICVISGVIVYHVVAAKMGGSQTSTSQNQNITFNPEALAVEVTQLKEIWKQQFSSLSNESRETLIDMHHRLDKINITSRDTKNQLDTIDSMVQVLQENQNSSVEQIAFTVHSPTGTLVDGTPTFRTVVLNEGRAYNASTGRFTAPVQGTYLFTLTLLSDSSTTRSYLTCNVLQNSVRVTQAWSQEGRHDSASVTMFLQLSVGDVALLICHNWQYVHTDQYTLFSGALVRAD